VSSPKGRWSTAACWYEAVSLGGERNAGNGGNLDQNTYRKGRTCFSPLAFSMTSPRERSP
jgi:hypothetical protein